jgi:hypothetical protein
MKTGPLLSFSSGEMNPIGDTLNSWTLPGGRLTLFTVSDTVDYRLVLCILSSWGESVGSEDAKGNSTAGSELVSGAAFFLGELKWTSCGF